MMNNEKDQILSENIKVEPFEILQLLELSLAASVNDHTKVHIRGIISADVYHQYLNQTETKTEIKINRRTESGEVKSFFCGYIQNIRITNTDQVFYLDIDAVSSTILLDLKKRNRSFQDKAMFYTNVIDAVLDQYDDAIYIDALSDERKTDQLFVQYEETDWEFIKRLASMHGGVVVTNDQMIRTRFYFGWPDTDPKGEIQSYNFETEKDLQKYRNIRENSGYDSTENNYTTFSVETLQMFELGDIVTYQKKEWVIVKAERKLEKGRLISWYVLAQKQGMYCLPTFNRNIKGVSLNGTVKAVQADKILTALDIDDDYRSIAAYWFSYSTGYTSDNNIGWYMMPEEGDRVRVYFPTDHEADAYAVGSIREDQGKEAYLNPDIKTLKNKFGKTITLEPDKITIFSDGVQISLDDTQGIVIKSDSAVIINGKEKIQIHGNEVLMDASEQIKFSVNSNSVTVDERIVLNGTEIKMN